MWEADFRPGPEVNINDPVREELSPLEAQMRVGFTLLVPSGATLNYRLRCWYVGPLRWPYMPPSVGLRLEDPHEDKLVLVTEVPEGDLGSVLDELVGTGTWEAAGAHGEIVGVTTAGHQVQAVVEQSGTVAFLMSESMGAAELASVARDLVPLDPTEC